MSCHVMSCYVRISITKLNCNYKSDSPTNNIDVKILLGKTHHTEGIAAVPADVLVVNLAKN